MRPVSDIRRAQALIEAGWPVLRAARELGLPRSTVRDWAKRGFDETVGGPMRRHQTVGCAAQTRAEAEPSTYAYLFGQYLGDGTIDLCPRNVYKHRILCLL